jgi:hypothetical protein
LEVIVRGLFLEELRDLEGDAEGSGDLELAGHVGDGGIEAAVDQLLEVVEAERERGLALAGLVADGGGNRGAVPIDDAVTR